MGKEKADGQGRKWVGMDKEPRESSRRMAKAGGERTMQVGN